MTNVNIEEEFYNETIKIVNEDKLEYPSITNFVNKAVKEKIEKLRGPKNVENSEPTQTE